MNTKFTILRHETQMQLQPHCPVLLMASAVTRNNLNGHIFAQCKFQNISSRQIANLSIKIYLKDVESGEKCFDFLYASVMASPYVNFGDTVPISLPAENADVTGISIEKIQFDIGEPWVNEDGERFKKAVQRKRISGQLTERLYSQYEKEIRKVTQVPVELVGAKDSGLIFCGCGTIYPQEYEKCPKCKLSFDDQIRISRPEFLEQCISHEQQLQEEKKRQKEERIHQTVLPIKRHPWIAVACLSGTVCCLAAAFFAIAAVRKLQDFQTRNPLSLNSIDTSQTWAAAGKDFYQVDVSAETSGTFAAVFTMPESKELQFVYLEDGAGILKCNFEEQPSALPELLGYVTGQKTDAAMVSVTVSAGPQGSDLYSHTAIVDFSLDPQYGKDGIMLFSLYDGLSGKASTNQYVPIVDGKGSISYSLADSAKGSGGSYDTPLSWAEKIQDKIIAEPIFFIASEEMTDTAYTAEDEFSYTSEQLFSSSSGMFDFRDYYGKQRFVLQDPSGLPKGMPKVVIYKDENLNDSQTTYKICKSQGRTAVAESYDFSGELSFTPKHKFSFLSYIPLRSAGPAKIFENEDRLSLDETKEVFQEEWQNFSNLIDNTKTTVTYYAENEIDTQEELETFQNAWLQYSEVALGIQQRLSEKMPPVEYEEAWKSFANSMQNIAEDLKLCAAVDFDQANQDAEGSSSFSVGIDRFVQHSYDVIDAVKELQQALGLDVTEQAG